MTGFFLGVQNCTEKRITSQFLSFTLRSHISSSSHHENFTTPLRHPISCDMNIIFPDFPDVRITFPSDLN